MSKIKHELIEQEIVFNEEVFTSLSIVNPHFLLKFINQLKDQIETGEGPFFLETKDKGISFKNCVLWSDPLNIVRDEKKDSTYVIKEVSTSLTVEQKDRFSEIQKDLNDFIDELCYSYPIRLTQTPDISLSSILKAVSLGTSPTGESFLEDLLGSIKRFSYLSKVKIFFIMHLKSYLTMNELLIFIIECRKLDVEVVLIDAYKPQVLLNSEKNIYIDHDLAEL